MICSQPFLRFVVPVWYSVRTFSQGARKDFCLFHCVFHRQIFISAHNVVKLLFLGCMPHSPLYSGSFGSSPSLPTVCTSDLDSLCSIASVCFAFSGLESSLPLPFTFKSPGYLSVLSLTLPRFKFSAPMTIISTSALIWVTFPFKSRGPSLTNRPRTMNLVFNLRSKCAVERLGVKTVRPISVSTYYSLL